MSEALLARRLAGVGETRLPKWSRCGAFRQTCPEQQRAPRLACLYREGRSHGPPVTPSRQLAMFVTDRQKKVKGGEEEQRTQVDAANTSGSLAQITGPFQILSLYICLNARMSSAVCEDTHKHIHTHTHICKGRERGGDNE